jgi:hypothetical protein
MTTKQSKKESGTLNPEFFPTWCPTTILLQAVAISALLTKGVFTGPRIVLSMVFKVKAKSWCVKNIFLTCVKIADNLLETFSAIEQS